MRSNRHQDRPIRFNPEQEYLVNGWQRSPTVRLINEDGVNVGIVDTKSAMDNAQGLGLDLITISKDATPPVCRIYDFSKFMYEQKKVKKEQERKNRENVIIVKEIQLRPGIDDHDLLVKQRHANGFLEDNHKIKIVMKFRGREMAFTKRGFDLVHKFLEGLKDHKVEKDPGLSGNTLMTIIAPIPKTVKT